MAIQAPQFPNIKSVASIRGQIGYISGLAPRSRATLLRHYENMSTLPNATALERYDRITGTNGFNTWALLFQESSATDRGIVYTVTNDIPDHFQWAHLTERLPEALWYYSAGLYIDFQNNGEGTYVQVSRRVLSAGSATTGPSSDLQKFLDTELCDDRNKVDGVRWWRFIRVGIRRPGDLIAFTSQELNKIVGGGLGKKRIASIQAFLQQNGTHLGDPVSWHSPVVRKYQAELQNPAKEQYYQRLMRRKITTLSSVKWAQEKIRSWHWDPVMPLIERFPTVGDLVQTEYHGFIKLCASMGSHKVSDGYYAECATGFITRLLDDLEILGVAVGCHLHAKETLRVK